jgi:hypothetical protein
MSETINEMLADISQEIGVDDDKLSTLAKLAQRQEAMEKAIADTEQLIKERKAELQKLKTETIPDFMDEVGIESFVTSSGRQIKVEPFYQCSIPKDRKDEAFKWLTEHGYEDLIKVNVGVTFGKSQYEEACELSRTLDELGYPVVPVLNVHPMTLKGWVRNMSEEGEEFPLDLFGAFIGRTTKLK